MTTPLEYAPPQKWHQRNRVRRAAWLLLILAIVVIALWNIGPPIYDKIRMLDWQRKCLSRVEPPGMSPIHSIWSVPPPPPIELLEFNKFLTGTPRTTRFYTFGYPNNGKLAYLHSRTNSAGERLVQVTFFIAFTRSRSTSTAASAPANHPILMIRTIEPGTLFSSPKILSEKEFMITDERFRTANLRFDADPADDSAFILTIISADPSVPAAAATQTATFRINAKDEAEIGTNYIGL